MTSITQTLQEILQGKHPDEREGDVLHMCFTVASMRLTLGQDYFGPGVPEIVSTLTTDRFERLLRGAGIVLCPIFDPLKHRDYSRFAERMVETRLSYAGIATDPELQLDFARKALTANTNGAFNSLSAASEAELWAQLKTGVPIAEAY